MAIALAPSTLTANELARSFNEQHPNEPADRVAQRAIASLSPSFAALIAEELLTREVESVRRAAALVTEKKAVVHSVQRANTKVQERQQRITAVQQMISSVRMNWSRELLDTTFTVGGVAVRWGSATIDQHQEYIDVLAVQVAGNLDNIARHEEAIRAIKAAGVANLDAV